MPYKILLVANAGVAHIYQCQGTKVLKMLETFEAEELLNLHHSHGKRENFFGKPNSSSHLLDPHQEAKEINRQTFARIVVEKLKTLNQEQDFKSLVLIAEAKFLGDLRNNLDKALLQLVEKEMPKDLTHYNIKDLEKYLEM